MKKRHHLIARGAIKVPVPNSQQMTDSSCGAAALHAVCRFYGGGAEWEEDYIREMRFDPRVGSHPGHIIRTARKYGFRTAEYVNMTLHQLKELLRRRIPVLMMIQAWGEKCSYCNVWGNGHWVVAIGYDRHGIYCEDPSLPAIRGYLSYEQLEDRWHDLGPRNKRFSHYGIAVWKNASAKTGYLARARVIE